MSTAAPTLTGAAPSRSAGRAALRDVLPVGLAVAPFGLVVGMTISEVGVPPIASHVSSLLLFSGSAQLAVLLLLDGGAGLATVVVTAAVVSARFVVYGAALAPHFQQQARWFRWFGPHLLIDQTFGLITARGDLTEPTRFRRYWLTAGSAIGALWLTATVAGSLLSAVLPAGSPLEVATPALFVGMLVPRLSDRRAAGTAVAATVLVLLLRWLPGGVGLPLAIVGAMVTGVAAFDRRPEDPS